MMGVRHLNLMFMFLKLESEKHRQLDKVADPLEDIVGFIINTIKILMIRTESI